ncbi:Ubiquitin-conjugating enzyme E2 4 [Trapelia coarctata]|nr:Ubiquitin-conjugating enzyme E2 4 [Trapelia coarctata]
MGDPVGIALGVTGLAGLFPTCVQCFDLVQPGDAFARDYEIVQTKFEAQKIRFLIWAQVVGLTEAGTFDERLELPIVRPTVCRILNCIQLLFSDAGVLSKRYGLRRSEGTVMSAEPHSGGVFKEAYLRFQAKLAKDQRDANILTKGRWAIDDNLFDLLGSMEGPPDSPYEGGIFYVRITIPDDFPWRPPECRFLTKIYHPNIDPHGRICLGVLEQDTWRYEFVYLDCLLVSTHCLLDEPSIADPLVPEISALYLNDKTAYDEIARDYTRKFATGTRPQMKAGDQAVASNQAASILQALHERILQPRSQQPRRIFFESQPLLGAMFQLSSELTVLAQSMDKPNEDRAFAVEKFGDLENFFDLCSGSFRGLTTHVLWRANFPDLPRIAYNATRSPGGSYTYEFTDIRSSQVGVKVLGAKEPTSQGLLESVRTETSDAGWSSYPGRRSAVGRPNRYAMEEHTPLLGSITMLVDHCRWLNGDAAITASSSKQPVERPRPDAAVWFRRPPPWVESYVSNFQTRSLD